MHPRHLSDSIRNRRVSLTSLLIFRTDPPLLTSERREEIDDRFLLHLCLVKLTSRDFVKNEKNRRMTIDLDDQVKLRETTSMNKKTITENNNDFRSLREMLIRFQLTSTYHNQEDLESMFPSPLEDLSSLFDRISVK